MLLALRDRQIRTLFESALDGMVVTDDDGFFVDANSAACELFGLANDDLIGRNLAGFIPPTLNLHQAWEAFLDHGQQRGELQLVRPDGNNRDLEFSGTANFLPHRHLFILRDITVQKQAQAELQFVRDRLQFLLANTAIVVYSCLAVEPYPITYVSQNVRGLVGYGTEEILEDPGFWVDRIHPADRERVLQGLGMALHQHPIHPYVHEYRFRRADGTYGWLQDEVRFIRDAGHQLVERVGCLSDISDRKQIEFSLQRQAEQEQRFSQVIEAIRSSLDLTTIFSVATAQVSEFLNAEVSIVKYCPERRCWVNQEVSDRGSRKEQKRDFEIPDEGNLIAEQLKRLQLVRIDNTDTLTDPINRPLAQRFPGSWLMAPIMVNRQIWGSLTLRRLRAPFPWPNEEAELAQRVADQVAIAIHQSELHEQVHILNVHLEQQVQERTRQLQQALEFEALLKRITDKVRDRLDEHQILQTVVEELALALDLDCCDTGIYDADKTTSTIVCEYTQTLKPIQGKSFPITEAAHPDLYTALLQGQICQVCDRIPNGVRDDQNFLTILACPIFVDQEVLGDLWLFRQAGLLFTEQEMRLVQQVSTQCAIALRQARLYQTAQAHVLELEQLHQVKDDFLSAVSHELRSPMSNIKMSAEMLEIQLSTMGLLCSEETPTSCNISTQRYFQILKEECQRETDLINDLLDLARLESGREVLTPMAIQLHLWVSHIVETFTERAKQQQLHLYVSIPRDLIIETDLSCLERILTELLHNACKYTPVGESIAISAGMVADGVEIHISNSGIEISSADQARIFEKFYRIPGSDPLRQGGTGLGLSLVWELTHYLKGQIRVQSGDRQTCFILTLPILFQPETALSSVTPTR